MRINTPTGPTQIPIFRLELNSDREASCQTKHGYGSILGFDWIEALHILPGTPGEWSGERYICRAPMSDGTVTIVCISGDDLHEEICCGFYRCPQ